MRRRDFLARSLGGAAVMLVAPRVIAAAQDSASAQQPAGTGPATGATSNLFDMDQAAAKTTRRPPKPGARESMTPDERDALEHQIRCQCGCTLDVYTCRTTDFSCQVSPAMHRDVMSLVEGGYGAQEILDAFVGTYGERALMSPKKQGFNWAGYIVPFAAVGTGAAVLVGVIRRMQLRAAGAAGVASAHAPVPVTPAGATDDEMARLQAAIRRDD